MLWNLLSAFSNWALPLLVLLIVTAAAVKRVNVYSAFVKGAKEGLETVFRIAPYLLAMLVAIRVFQSSGAMDLLTQIIAPVGNLVSAPRQVLPLAIVRPLSGSGSLGMLAGILQEHGPDSQAGLIASTVQGSTETTFYILTVYFGAVSISRARHAPLVGLLADVAGFIAAVLAVNWLWPQ